MKVSIGRFSLLGFVLLSTSAVTATILRNNRDESLVSNGTLTANRTSRVTCNLTNQINNHGCHASTENVPPLSSTATTVYEDEENNSNDTISSLTGDGGIGMNNTTDES